MSCFAKSQGKNGLPAIAMVFNDRLMIGMPKTDRNTVLSRTNRWLSVLSDICKEIKRGFS